MKIFTTLLLIFLFCSTSYTQTVSKDISEIKSLSAVNLEFLNSDNQIPSGILNMNSQLKSPKGDMILAGQDTLTQYFDRSTNFVNYFVTINQQTWPLFGINPVYNWIGPRYTTSTTIQLEGCLIAYSLKQINGNYPDTLLVWVFNTQNGVPSGSTIAIGMFNVSDIDTNSITPVFTPVIFDQPAITSTNFACLALTSLGNAEQDGTMIFSNQTGDSRGEQTTCGLLFNNGWVPFVYANVIQQLGGADPDADVMILPLIGGDSDVDDPISLDGLTINSIYPNPAVEASHINFVVDESTNMKISLIDQNGKKVKNLVNEFINAGEHNIELDLSGIASGSYYYTIITNKTKFAGKINVVK